MIHLIDHRFDLLENRKQILNVAIKLKVLRLYHYYDFLCVRSLFYIHLIYCKFIKNYVF